MRTLIVEDDFITSQVMQEIMLSFGECDAAENGRIGVEKFIQAYEENRPYNLIFLDIMMPEVTGQEALLQMREYETQKGIMGLEQCKVVMTTALDDFSNIKNAFKSQCEAYLVKPLDKDKIISVLLEFDLL